jgi:hypothetical protein
MKKIIILITLLVLASCGKPSEKCVTGSEKRLSCQAEWLANNSPINQIPNWVKEQCNNNYASNGCY